MTSPRKIEDGQQPEVTVSFLFQKGNWELVLTFKSSTDSNTVAMHLTTANFEDGVAEVKAILRKHGIK